MARSLDEISEELLVVRCRRHDAEAWNELVERFNGRLLYFIRRLLSDEDVARAVLQETWVGVVKNFSSLRSVDRLRPWLYSIARHRVMTHYRSEYKALAASTIEDSNIVEEGSTAETRFENAELVHFGLARIGLLEREVLTLFFLEDFSIAEIAGILEIPPGTVKSRLARARAELKSVLTQETDRTANSKVFR